jgi:hypothetical protein
MPQISAKEGPPPPKFERLLGKCLRCLICCRPRTGASHRGCAYPAEKHRLRISFVPDRLSGRFVSTSPCHGGTSVPVSVYSQSRVHIWSGLQRPPPNIQAQGPRFDAHLASRSVQHPCRQASIMYHRAGARVTLAAFAACMLAQSDAFQAPLPISSGAALPGIPEPTAGPASNEVRSGLRLL